MFVDVGERSALDWNEKGSLLNPQANIIMAKKAPLAKKSANAKPKELTPAQLKKQARKAEIAAAKVGADYSTRLWLICVFVFRLKVILSRLRLPSIP